MAGKRKYEIDMVATKSDIVKDIIADVVSQEVHKETGIACNKRENTEIRVNIIKLENLVKEYDLNNPEKEVPTYDFKENNKKILGLDKLKTKEVIKADLKKDEVSDECSHRKKKKSSRK